MDDFGELVEGFSSDALCGGVGCDEVWVLLLQCCKFVFETVENIVIDWLLIEDVICVAVVFDFPFEEGDALFGGRRHRCV